MCNKTIKHPRVSLFPGKVALVQKYLTDKDIYDNLNQLGTRVQMECVCSEAVTEHEQDTKMKPLGNEALEKSSSHVNTAGNNEEVVNGQVSSLMKADPIVNPRANSTTICSADTSNKSNVNVDRTSDILGELKCRDGVMDSNKSKRIKLEENVQLNVEVEKMLKELESTSKVLMERKSLMNAVNRHRMRELGEYLVNL